MLVKYVEWQNDSHIISNATQLQADFPPDFEFSKMFTTSSKFLCQHKNKFETADTFLLKI